LARKNSVTAENLAALGVERLAALLMDLGKADGGVRKRLVLALAERGGPANLIKAVDRRLTALANSYGEIVLEKEKTYAAEIDGLRRVITQSLAPVDARAAAERLSRLIRLAPAVLQRVDDSSGRFDGIFCAAVTDLATVWKLIDAPDPEAMAAAALSLIQDDHYGLCDDLVADAAPALGSAGLAALARRAAAALTELDDGSATPVRDGPRVGLLQVLSDIADARGDADAFIAVQAKLTYVDTAGIASRLIDAGRAAEALNWLDRSASTPGRAISPAGDSPGAGDAAALRPHPLDWERAALRIMALEQLERCPEAQALRWRLFEETLSVDVLRAYLRALPDFEDDVALDRAFAHAAGHPSALTALSFLARWPNLALAAKLVLNRANELDGRDYPILNAAADALSDAHPLAVTVIRRRMIDSVLDRAASNAYIHAARALAACQALEGEIDWSESTWPSHPRLSCQPAGSPWSQGGVLVAGEILTRGNGSDDYPSEG
jgi:hypothetical protein